MQLLGEAGPPMDPSYQTDRHGRVWVKPSIAIPHRDGEGARDIVIVGKLDWDLMLDIVFLATVT